MTNQKLDEAIAKCLWTRKDGGWFQKRFNGYEWHRELPVEPYSTDDKLALTLLDRHPDYIVRKHNGVYYQVTFFTSSQEFIGEGMTLAMATVLAFIELNKEKIK